MAVLRIQLLGGLNLTWDDLPLPPIGSRVACSLLAYLTFYRDRPHTRDLLIGTFWPDLPESTARRRLSRALWEMRQALGQEVSPGPLLRTSRTTIQLNPALPIWVDVEAFLEHHALCVAQGVDWLTHGEQCLAYYGGDFLAGYYDDWLLSERERLREMFLLALQQVAAGYKVRADYEQALVYARRWVSEDTWSEGAHGEVMRLCHLLGRDVEALNQYEACRRILAEEMGIEPSPEMSALAREIATRSGVPVPVSLPSSARPRGTPLLERPDRLPLVGRQAELAELLRQLEAAARGRGGLALVYGEPGVGKTRLLRELEDNARWRSWPSYWGQCYELAAPLAYQPLVEALRAGLPVLERSALPPPWRADLARLLPELAVDSRPPLPLAAEEERRRLLEAIARAFLALAEEAPALVLLEDAQWMDLSSLEALRYLLPRLAGARLQIVISARRQEMIGPAAALMTALEDTRLPRRLDLGRLDLDGTTALVQHALDLERPAPRFSARLYAETEGNPFFLIETLWTLLDEGLLYRDDAGVWHTPQDRPSADYADLPLPGGVAQSIERRLDRLPEPLEELLGLAAVIGREIDFELWYRASGWAREWVQAASQDLCSRGLFLCVDPASTAGFVYTFTHDQVRRVTYDHLPESRRAFYHRRVAEVLAQLAPDEPATLAYQWSQAGMWDKAVDYHQQAGERAQAVYALAEAADHYTQALAALERMPGLVDPMRRLDLLLAREAIYGRQGDSTAQAAELAALEALAETLDDDAQRAKVALRRARHAQATGDYPGALAAAQRAIDLAQGLELHELAIQGLLVQGNVLVYQGRYTESQAFFEQILPRIKQAGNMRQAARVLQSLGAIAWRQGRYADSQCHHRQALALYQQEGDRQGEGASLNNLGTISWAVGDLAQARSYYQQSLQIRREIGDRPGEGSILRNLGALALSLNEPLLALDWFQQALTIKREVGDREGEAMALNGLGSATSMLGDYVRARFYCEQGLVISRETGDRQSELIILTNLGKAFGDLGDYAQARYHAGQALQLSRELGDLLGELLALGELSRISRGQGHHQAARDDAQQAIPVARKVGHPESLAKVLALLGNALEELGEWAEASAVYEQAVGVWQDESPPHLMIEPYAGLARAALAQSDLPTALEKIPPILDFMERGAKQSRSFELSGAYLTCYQVLQARDDPRAGGVLVQAYGLLREWVDHVEDEALRRRLWEDIPAHREIIAAYRKQQQAGRPDSPKKRLQITVRLPRADALRGQPPHDDEYTTVTWTVVDPADAAFPGKVARRRHRLLRLLEEAHAQGAAPRQDDLAEVLGVSRRTIERDIAALRQGREEFPLLRSRGKTSE